MLGMYFFNCIVILDVDLFKFGKMLEFFENLTSLVIEMFNLYLDLRASLYNVDILYNNPQMILLQLENLGIENNQQLMRKVFHPYYHLDRNSIYTKVLTNIDQNQNELIFKNQTTM